jgi:hypothetical protein
LRRKCKSDHRDIRNRASDGQCRIARQRVIRKSTVGNEFVVRSTASIPAKSFNLASVGFEKMKRRYSVLNDRNSSIFPGRVPRRQTHRSIEARHALHKA